MANQPPYFNDLRQLFARTADVPNPHPPDTANATGGGF
jgi:hypothetical protein